jgi:hypothetical protein
MMNIFYVEEITIKTRKWIAMDTKGKTIKGMEAS